MQTPHVPSPQPALTGLNLDQMKELVTQAGQPAFRAKQLYHWVYEKGVSQPAAMHNLPAKLKSWLEANTRSGMPEVVKVQGPADQTQKVLFRLEDGSHIESVIMREGEAAEPAPGEPERVSLCVSSQVGCAMGCTFCMTGFGGFQRNLSAGEIVGQLLGIRAHCLTPGTHIQHVVFMGMGEPMHNLEAVVPAIELLTDPHGCGVSRRRLTVSTVGLVPQIEAFGAQNPGVGLAVSLNATTDEVRSQIMPVNRRWPIAQLLATLEKFPMETRRRITIEYVLMDGINDSLEDARRLTRLLRPLRCKVNLIMFNANPHLPYQGVSEQRLNDFMAILSQAHYTVTVRWSKGREVEAACGLLAAHYFEGKEPAQ